MTNRIIEIVLSMPPLLLGLTVHEFFHGYVALKMGDPTAKFAGRLSFNPIKHIDLFGFLAFLLFRFGWARPVPINPYNFDNYKKGMLYTAVAGPLSNFLLAILFGLLLRSLPNIFYSPLFTPLWLMLQLGLIYNLIMCAFNLIPLPPLDGSKVLFSILPAKYAHIEFLLARNGLFILMGLIFLDNVLGIPVLWGWIGPFVRFFGTLFAGPLVLF